MVVVVAVAVAVVSSHSRDECTKFDRRKRWRWMEQSAYRSEPIGRDDVLVLLASCPQVPAAVIQLALWWW